MPRAEVRFESADRPLAARRAAKAAKAATARPPTGGALTIAPALQQQLERDRWARLLRTDPNALIREIAKRYQSNPWLAQNTNLSLYHFSGSYPNRVFSAWTRAELERLFRDGLKLVGSAEFTGCVERRIQAILDYQAKQPVNRATGVGLPPVVLKECRREADFGEFLVKSVVMAAAAVGAAYAAAPLMSKVGAAAGQAAAATGGATSGAQATAAASKIATTAAIPSAGSAAGTAAIKGAAVKLGAGTLAKAGAGGVAALSSLAKQGAAALAKAMPAINLARQIEGKAPIDIGSGSFLDLATGAAATIVQDKLKRDLTRQERELLEQYARETQRDFVDLSRTGIVPGSVPGHARNMLEAEPWLLPAILIGGAGILAIVLQRQGRARR